MPQDHEIQQLKPALHPEQLELFEEYAYEDYDAYLDMVEENLRREGMLEDI